MFRTESVGYRMYFDCFIVQFRLDDSMDDTRPDAADLLVDFRKCEHYLDN